MNNTFNFEIHSHNWEKALLSLTKENLKGLCTKYKIPFEGKTKERMAKLLENRVNLEKGITIEINLNNE